MPKKRWSASDERKYKHILKSCKISQGRKKGAAKMCKRIAAATVERDIGFRGLGASSADEKRWPGITAREAKGSTEARASRRLWDDYEQRKAVFERAAARWDAEGTDEARAAKRQAMDELADSERALHNWRYHRRLGVGGLGALPARGMGAQLLSVNLGGPWQAGGSILQSNAEFQQKDHRTAIISNAEDPDFDPSSGEVVLGVYDGKVLEGDDLRQVDHDYYPSISAAKSAAKRMGFDGLRGTVPQHRAEAKRLLESAESLRARGFPIGYVEMALTREAQEGRWLPKRDRETNESRAVAITTRAYDDAVRQRELRLGSLGCACNDAPSGLGGRRRKRKTR